MRHPSFDCEEAIALARWRDRAQTLAREGDVFLYFISGAKEQNPQAALALLASLEPR